MASRTSLWRISVDHEGECSKILDDPDCDCPRLWDPVCGTNNITYGSECLLDCAALKNSEIKMAYNFRCSSNQKYFNNKVRG